MFWSVFDIFKIGVGPSSSHTMGPMVAAGRFLDDIAHGDWPRPAGAEVAALTASLHGSLAFTGIEPPVPGRAVTLSEGSPGYLPDTIEPDEMDRVIAAVESSWHRVRPRGHRPYRFRPAKDLYLRARRTRCRRASNGLQFSAFDDRDGVLLLAGALLFGLAVDRWCPTPNWRGRSPLAAAGYAGAVSLRERGRIAAAGASAQTVDRRNHARQRAFPRTSRRYRSPHRCAVAQRHDGVHRSRPRAGRPIAGRLTGAAAGSRHLHAARSEGSTQRCRSARSANDRLAGLCHGRKQEKNAAERPGGHRADKWRRRHHPRDAALVARVSVIGADAQELSRFHCSPPRRDQQGPG